MYMFNTGKEYTHRDVKIAKMEKVTMNDVVERLLKEEALLYKKQVLVVDTVMKVLKGIAMEVAEGKAVTVYWIGTFYPNHIGKRRYYDMYRQQAAETPENTVAMRFVSWKALKQKINEVYKWIKFKK